MKCPGCTDVSLVMTERQSVEIDYCPQCRGVWLDRGELDKLIECAAAPEPAARPATASRPVLTIPTTTQQAGATPVGTHGARSPG